MTYTLHECPHDTLTAAIEAGARAKPGIRRQRAIGFRASGLASCLRMRGYEVQGRERSDETFVPDYSLAAELGNTIHGYLQRWLVASGLVFQWPIFGPAVELPLSVCCPADRRDEMEQLVFSGHIDAVLEHRGALSILDIKTVASKYMDESYPWRAGKLQSYAVQLHAYGRYCQAPDGRVPEQGLVLMVSRDDTRQRRLYRVPWQWDVFEKEMERLRAAHRAVIAGALPEAETERGPCVFCAWRTRCEEERD